MSSKRKHNICLVALGRYNPPHIGHTELFHAGFEYASTHDMDYIICPTNTQDCIKNPLKLNEKIKFLNLIAPKYSKYILFNMYPNALEGLISEKFPRYNSTAVKKYLTETIGYQNIVIYHTEPTQYTQPKFGLPIDAVEAKERRYDNISATKIRKAVLDNNFNRFVSYYAVKNKSLNDKMLNSNEVRRSNEKREILNRSKTGSLNDISKSINSDNFKTVKLIGNLKIEDLKELFNILKKQLECKEPLKAFQLPKHVNRRISAAIVADDPYFNF